MGICSEFDYFSLNSLIVFYLVERIDLLDGVY